ncbi:GTP-binding protein REM 1-like isoform X2 [Tachypleus tridentatus]|uniref:GTP-binding protein REM 1-like isoform X2 n=1 Tax=Tachypleus tridentatus TaxID=6853 RepID=UPI003FCF0727
MTLGVSKRSVGPNTRYRAMSISTTQACSMPDLQFLFTLTHSSCRTTPRNSPSSSPVRAHTTCQNKSGGRGLKQPESPRRATYPLTSPFQRRRSKLWTAEEVDPWAQFRRRMVTSPGSLISSGHRLRRFSVTTKGIIHLGDLVRDRSRSDIESSYEGSRSDSSERPSSSYSTRRGSNPARHRVMILGEDSVGKASLVSHFLNSEYLTGYESYYDSLEEDNERSVSVFIEGEETELTFQCESSLHVTVDDTTFSFTDAFLVVYSVTDRVSYEYAGRTLALLRYLGTKHSNHILGPDAFPKALILVGNKTDLVRSRTVTEEEGRTLANKYNVKFIETSAAITHNVDELLVGVISQIRLRSSTTTNDNAIYRSKRFSGKALGLMSKFLQKCEFKVRSCDNLHVL